MQLVLRLVQPGSPTDGFSVFFVLFRFKTEAESSFQNVAYNLDEGKNPKE
jgi:hypothetical protein